MRMNISIPADLKAEMEKVDINWSAVAQRAFREQLERSNVDETDSDVSDQRRRQVCALAARDYVPVSLTFPATLVLGSLEHRQPHQDVSIRLLASLEASLSAIDGRTESAQAGAKTDSEGTKRN